MVMTLEQTVEKPEDVNGSTSMEEAPGETLDTSDPIRHSVRATMDGPFRHTELSPSHASVT